MATVKYKRVEEYLKSLTGIDTPTDEEKAWWRTALNRRIRAAYESARFWPRYTKEELRYAGFDNVIPTQSDGFTEIDTFHKVWSADPRGTSTTVTEYDFFVKNDGAKLLNVADGDYQEVLYTATASTGGSTSQGSIATSSSPTAQAISFWMRVDVPTTYGTGTQNIKILAVNADGGGVTNGDALGEIYLTIDNSTSTVQGRNDWYLSDAGNMYVYGDGLYLGTDFGISGVGVELQNSFDGEWHHFIWTFRPADNISQNLGEFYYELNSGASAGSDLEFEIADVRVYKDKISAADAWAIYSNPERVDIVPAWASSIPEYFVSYKRALTTEYGYASDGFNEDIPLEFFEYGYHGAYADWLRAEGQTDKARVEEAFANEHLERQLEKISYTNGSPYLWSRYSTHNSRQTR